MGNENTYKETEEYWNAVFEDVEMKFDPECKISVDKIEDCLDWMVDEGSSIIDFGCGNGKLLIRCSAKGAEKGTGIDISSEGIDKAEKIAEKTGSNGRMDFVVGGKEILQDLQENEFDGGILSNIIDNLLPEDSKEVLKELNRIIEPDGKIFLKLNDHIDPDQMDEWNAKNINGSLYKEEGGLYLWNLTDEEVKNILNEHFKIEKRVDVELEGQTNRLYYLRNL